MTLPIHEQGGLTGPEIQLRIDEATDRQATTLEQKLKAHEEAIDRRLATTDQALREVAAQTSDLKADVAVLMASDSQQTELLKQIVAKGDEWHDADVDFRMVLIQRVSMIETEQAHLADQMKLLRWLATLSSSLVKAFSYVMETENFRFFIIAGLIFLTLHSFAPQLISPILHWIESLK